ncbi:MAG: hypothetical protein ABI273_12150 [Lacunisphaera sp.]
MNLVWHLIKKDFSHNWLGIRIWALSGIAAVYFAVNPIRDLGTWGGEMGICCLMTHGVLVLGLIASIYQEDSRVDSEGFLLTRPISPRRLLSAKLGLVLALFVVVPLLFLFGERMIKPAASWAPRFGTIGLNLTFIVLAASAVAACCKSSSRYLLALCAVFFGFGFSRLGFSSLVEATPLVLRALLHETKLTIIPILFSGFFAAALYHIYYRRRVVVAICFITVGVVGSALMSDFLTMPLPR